MDLFWALRGGSGSNFGIVTKLKFKMHKGPKSVVYGIYYYNFDNFLLFFNAWQSFITSKLPDHIGTELKIIKSTIQMVVFYFNFENNNNVTISAMDIDNILSSFSFPKAMNGTLKLQSYSDYLKSSYNYSAASNYYIGWKKVKSMYVSKVLNKDNILKLQELLRPFLKWSVIHLYQDGGAIDNISRTATAFVHRNDIYNIQLQAFNPDSKDENINGNTEMNIFYEKSKLLFDHSESYQNYLDEDLTDLKRYYGENLERLIEIKKRVDPQNVFHHALSIPTSFIKLKK